MNIANILKNCPKGMVLYSPIFGEVKFCRSNPNNDTILVQSSDGDGRYFDADGKYYNLPGAEVMLFPSKENRDWRTFKPVHKFEPFQKVLVRDFDTQAWGAGFFSHMDESPEGRLYHTTSMWYRQCIPYNETTKHLLGTSRDA